MWLSNVLTHGAAFEEGGSGQRAMTQGRVMTDAWAAFSAPHVPASTGCRPRRAGQCGRARRRASEMPAVERAVEVDVFAPVLKVPRGMEDRSC